MSTAEAERQTMLVQVEHPFCRGTGRVIKEQRVVVKSQQAHHYKHHAYRKVQNGEPVGEECDCKWTTKKTETNCVGCGGHGTQHITLIVPEPGDKVIVRSRELLEQLFGDEIPEGPATVVEVLKPEEHQWEMEFGLAINVTWDRLNSKFKVPKAGATLWAFGLAEIKVVKQR